MTSTSGFFIGVLPWVLAAVASAHTGQHDGFETYDRSARPPLRIALLSVSGPAEAAAGQPMAARVFAPFAPSVRTRWDDRFFYVESNGMPDHRMMVGITAWQQQVPLPQPYNGTNAWRFPLRPVEAAHPLSAKDHFFRGAIAIAANGVPIFNPIKNDGRTDTFLAGELDEFGGHAGRADDYHYHIAPLHLQSIVGPGQPVAYALDGYPIHGLTEPDGAAVTGLDEFNGHATPALGYHYHSSRKYPYLNGGFHGEVVERGGQVDPQPLTQGVREALTPLRGARITGFTVPMAGSYSVEYQVGGEKRRVDYTLNADRTVTFTFVNGAGPVVSHTYSARSGGKGGGGGERPQREGRAGAPREHNSPAGSEASGRQPWIKVHAGEMDGDHDGMLTRAEVEAEVSSVFAAYDRDQDGRISAAEHGEGGVRSALGGFVPQHAKEIDADRDGWIRREELMATVVRMLDRADTNRDSRLAGEELALPPGYKPTPPGGDDRKSERKD